MNGKKFMNPLILFLAIMTEQKRALLHGGKLHLVNG